MRSTTQLYTMPAEFPPDVPVRDRPAWMHRSHVAVLEFLENRGDDLVSPPFVIAENTGLSRSTADKAVRELRDRGLVTYYDEASALYRITDRGLSFLEGDVPAEALEDG